MNLSNLVDRAKQMVGRRGGTESLKEDAQELRDIARQEGSMTDKAKDAAEALKDPGAPGEPGQRTEPGQPTEPGQGERPEQR